MRKVTLINPPNVKTRKGYMSWEAVPNLGLAYIAASISSGGHEVTVIDAVGEALDRYQIFDEDFFLQGLSFSQICDRIPADTEVIGISNNFSLSWFVVHELMKEIKKRYPRVFIILGGEHITGDWEAVLQLAPEADYCVLGEGEETILDLLTNIEKPSVVKGIAYRSEGVPVQTERRTRIKAINEIPRPLWTSMPVSEYMDRGYSFTGYGTRSIPILASRGCVYKCTFCSSPNMWGTTFGLRDIDDIIDEVKSYIRDYKINQVELNDLIGVFNREWTLKFMDRLIEEKLDLEWIFPAGTRSELLNEEMVKKFKDSKIGRLVVAPETGSSKTIKDIQKRADLDKIYKTIKYASKLDIPTRANIIIGFPGMTFTDYFQTLFYTLKLTWAGISDHGVSLFLAYPGTELHNRLRQRGQIPTAKTSPEDYQKFLRSLGTNKFSGHLSFSEQIPSSVLHFLMLLTLGSNIVFQYAVRPQRLWSLFHRSLLKRRPLNFTEYLLYNLTYRRRKILPQEDSRAGALASP